METEKQITLLMSALDAQQTCIRDMGERISALENSTANKVIENKYSSKQHQHTPSSAAWLIRCMITGGSFSTLLWRNEVIRKDTCPCCGMLVQRIRT